MTFMTAYPHGRPLAGAANSIAGYALTSRAHAVNEDLAFIGENVAWVIDGATPIGGGPVLHPVSDARWFVEVADGELRKHADSPSSLVSVVERVTHAVSDRIRRLLPDWQYPPSAALGIVRVRDGQLDFLQLADVTVVVREGDRLWLSESGETVAHERRLLELERSSGRSAMQEEIVNRRRTQMNRPDGYWVFSDDPTAVKHARHGTMPITVGSRIFLGTDGFCRLASTYHHRGWEEIVDADHQLATAYFKELRHVENEDPDRVAYPRISTADDATGVWLDAGA
jgi:hypothetical protein